MHTRDEKIVKRAARRDRRGPENTKRGLNNVGESLRNDAKPRRVTCVGQSPACVRGPELRA